MAMAQLNNLDFENQRLLEQVEEVRRAMYGYWLKKLRWAKEHKLQDAAIAQCQQNLSSFLPNSDLVANVSGSQEAAERFVSECSAFLRNEKLGQMGNELAN